MTSIYVVYSKTFNRIVGAYSDEATAITIAKCNNCTVDCVHIDAVYPGYLDSIHHIFDKAAQDKVGSVTWPSEQVVYRVKH